MSLVAFKVALLPAAVGLTIEWMSTWVLKAVPDINTARTVMVGEVAIPDILFGVEVALKVVPQDIAVWLHCHFMSKI